MGDFTNYPKLFKPSDNSTIVINNNEFLIGRSLSCDHVIESLLISRSHCVVKKLGDKWALYDKSSNGTMINDHLLRTNESRVLKTGDVIKLAEIEHVFVNANETLVSSDRKDCDEDDVKAVEIVGGKEEPIRATQEPPSKRVQRSPGKNMDLMDNELSCSICSELFIKAVTLSCSHSFCRYCIEQWRKNKQTCPICRVSIATFTPTLVLDSLIEKMMETQGADVKETRRAIVAEREALAAPTPGTSGLAAAGAPVVIGNSVIEIDSDEDEDEMDDTDSYDESYGGYEPFYRRGYHDDDDEDDERSDDDFDEDPDYTGLPGHYFGGYGVCFTCGDPGHWANGCPKRRR